MGFSDVFLKRAVLGLSVALVLMLTGVALSRLLSSGETVTSPGTTTPNDNPDAPATATGVYPGARLTFDDSEAPLTIGCLQDRTANGAFLIVIENLATTVTDYTVSAALHADGGTTVDATARVGQLQPGEQREVVLIPEQEIADPADCTIMAVESDRRVLLRSG